MSESTSRPQIHLLSTGQMPFAPTTEPGLHVTWRGTDTEENYRERPHPTLGPRDLDYRFNAHGYRCREFDAAREPGTITVLALGASEVLGTGVPQEQTFPAVFARLLGERLGRPAIDWNLGVGGSAADYIARTLVSALPVLKPDVVLMVFPHPARRELLGHNGRIHYYTNDGARKLSDRFTDPERHALTQASMNLSSEFSDAMSMYKNYKVCEALCQQHGAMWLFSSTREAFMTPIAHLVDPAHWVRPGLADMRDTGQDAKLAMGRDMQHPGIGPHRETAERMLEQLQGCHGDRLRALAQAAPQEVDQTTPALACRAEPIAPGMGLAPRTGDLRPQVEPESRTPGIVVTIAAVALHLLLVLLFFVVFTPLAVLLRAFGIDLIGARGNERMGSYWRQRGPGQRS